MAFRKHFLQTLQNYYPESYLEIMRSIESHYESISRKTAFAAKSSNPLDRRLDFSAYFLAFITALDGKGESFEKMREISLEIAKAYVKPKNKFHSYLKRLPPKLINTKFASWLLKKLNRKVSSVGHPDGFRAKIITNKEETYGFGYGIDILECGICKLFGKFDKQKYVPILCEVDKLTSTLAGLELIRGGTIANGSEKCDFRFRKK